MAQRVLYVSRYPRKTPDVAMPLTLCGIVREPCPAVVLTGRAGQWIRQGITFGGWRIWKQTGRGQGLARIAVAC
jgi:hypothetical protein